MGCSRPWPAIWNSQWDEDCTSVFAWDNFDLDAVNQTLLESMDYGLQNTLPGPADGSVPSDPNLNFPHGPTLVQKKWHTFSEATIPSGDTTPECPRINNTINTRADDRYRQKLVESLQQRVQPGILPSTKFLDLCLQAYFTHFQTIFPLIHAPTFQPSKGNAVLLLSMCTIGSLFLGSSKALTHGISMFERLNKAILASWDTYMQATGSASIQALQASLIGQTFGLLLGRPKDLDCTEAFHGCIVAWARKLKLFHSDETPIGHMETLEDDSEALNATWKSWARLEEKKRITLAIHIHDAELAKLHHHEPMLRHAPEKLVQISAPELFAAPNSKSWKALFTRTQPPTRDISLSPESGSFPCLRTLENDFQSYATLDSIGALAYEDRDFEPSWHATMQKCQGLLIDWYQKYVTSSEVSHKPDHFCLIILWHSIFMHLYTRFDDLECACGRDGEGPAQKQRAYATSWAASENAARTLLHAILIQQHFQLLPVGAEPAIHVPMALYYCGIAWTSFTRFGSKLNERSVDTTELFNFPEMRSVGISQTKLFQDSTSSVQWGNPESAPFFRIIDLLGKISHWKVSGSFVTTLLSLVEDTQDLF
ncbi:fungal-specific transcription factor domain-containing protein [Aspergillus pseudotamarii]|uniref:Fungal-specific transcription factor domain-containing protein n=1 Tax=Aspergillus pseudotamarii TaxID=132259 RepID=A0A5N6TCE9_ASPPS|nr:fungal-specific transcription factor domain-containing protein [Aspergillus pseudotamarii]KAE8143801.1 fungal-specific transcription factor domain-containing protein [Aspergillus pseudotamarii]